MTASLRYLWGARFGRLAISCVLVGIVGLATHLWLPYLTLLALSRDKELARLGYR